ncbi:acyloxyacyl hydrolase [Xylophilus sp.]|uniref:acyloxyacyl hydrolase n=1 Tax=Xylophilus sp. TaxID=2653893 RepID=UPI0013B5FCFB|nr:acyloxyacyl hydrolase [Xylophilus sp.]KAF1044270.1 MAG: Lipid A deacylase PagL [Xylophilus sp.]
MLSHPLPFPRRGGAVSAAALLAFGLLIALGAGDAAASGRADERPGIYVQGGENVVNGHDTQNVFIGGTLPFGDRHANGSLTYYGDAYLGAWHGRLPDGIHDKTYHQIAALAVARWRFDHGNSPWFADAGAGVSYLDGIYAKPGKVFDGRPGRYFGSRWNFALRLGAGYSFGQDGQHEVSLNYAHFSDAGLKRPNPGEDFIQLRYAYKF